MTHERFCTRRLDLGQCDCNLAEPLAEIERRRALLARVQPLLADDAPGTIGTALAADIREALG